MIISIFVSFLLVLPFGNLDRIRKAIQKMEYDKAEELIARARSKDASDPGVEYFASLLFSNEAYRSFNLDSARIFINRSLNKFSSIDEESKLDLKDDGITLGVLEEFRDQLRDRIYSRLLNDLSVGGVENFMSIYSGSPYEDELVFKRDSMVFITVQQQDDISSYEQFLQNHGTESFRKLSLKRLDELRFQELQESRELDSYYRFHRAHPKSAFLSEVEEYVFQHSTKSHDPTKYRDFIAFARSDKWKRQAANLLFYLADDPTILDRDSVSEVRKSREVRLIPAMENELFGFHSEDGTVHIAYQFSNVAADYKCEPTSADWLLVEQDGGNQIVNKVGARVVSNVSSYKDLGYGASLVTIKGDNFLYHKSGFRILDRPIDDAEVIGGKWIKVTKDARVAVASFTGLLLTDYEFNDIYVLGDFWVFEKGGLIAVSNEEKVNRELTTDGLSLEFKFDDLELVEDAVMIGFRDDRECMLGSDLDFLIPWGVYEINPDASTWYLKTDVGYRIYDRSVGDILDEIHPYLETNDGWLILQTNEDWMLLPRNQEVVPSRGYDSLKLINNHYVYALKDDSSVLLCSNGTERPLNEGEIVRTFINQKENVLIEGQEKLVVLDTSNNELIGGEYQEITFLNDTLIRILDKKKYGLFNLNGEPVLSTEYDAINLDDDLVLTLRENLIGSFDLTNGVVIPPTSRARVERINGHYTVEGEKGYGLLDSAKNEVLSKVYEEIQYWNDTSYLVSVEDYWMILSDKEQVVSDTLQTMSPIATLDGETLWRYIADGKYGLISSQNGVILGANYTDIVNIGSRNKPLFFADQHLDMAQFHVVSYINQSGELLFSKAYNKENFDRVLCDD